MTVPTEPDELAHMDRVDVATGVRQATEPDEEQVLEELYGPPDQYGFYRGEGQSA